MRRISLPRTELVSLAAIVGCVLFLFRLSLFQGWTFIGNSDRLNSIFNTRLIEIVGLQKYGTVPFWSDQQLMGFSMVSLHWMLTTYSPVPYLLALLPPTEMLHALAALSALMLALTIGGTYWLFGAYTTHPLARLTGAVLFGLGAFTIHKLTQLDLSFLAIVAMPYLLLLVRETCPANAARTFLVLTVIWAFTIGYTVLQEIAYIAMFYSTYALYRSLRLRQLWPVLVAGLAFVCAVVIASPRVITVAQEIPDLARTSANFQTAPIEVLRYFGDGLLGRTHDENEAVRGATLNLHEGVQLLTSALGAWLAVVSGLLLRSGIARAWAIGLVLVLSTGLALWWRPFYDSLGRFEPISRELRIVVMNAVLIGVPLWLVTWLMARQDAKEAPAFEGAPTPNPSPAHGDVGEADVRAAQRTGWEVGPSSATWPEVRAAPARETLEAVRDAPYFLGFATLGLAAILLPEARTVLYYGFMRMDFQHGRLSLAITLPLAALVAILLSRFLPSGAGRAATRWLVAGLLAGLGLWLVREALASTVLASYGDVLEPTRPRRLLTVETVRVATSLLVMLVAIGLLVARARSTVLAAVGGVLAAWMLLESLSAAEFRLNGPHILRHDVPFNALNAMQVPPGQFRVPTAEERAVLHARLETDQYRSALKQNPLQFPALVDSHLAAFWDLRLIEGYITGLPRRFTLLPWDDSIYTSHHLDLSDRQNMPWRILALLNVKYVVTVDQSLWYNPAPGGSVPPLDVRRLSVQENPNPVAPRAFFAARVSPAGDPPRLPGDTGERPPPVDAPVPDPREHTVVEGLGQERTYASDGTLNAIFTGDRVTVRIAPAPEDRFLVVNDRYYPGWHATIDGRHAEIYPTNLVMRGVLVPAGASLVEMRFVPFIATPPALILFVGGVVLTGLVWWSVRFGARRSR